ncbi:hypothetical protein M0E87_12270 [Corynebacterium sp. CCM 9185]|uniref:Uncharacterized protein n=1 Tax=Corynebacterium marambiense TaxID=2765364 RepID=A0ABS0VX75_9CORY|nr:hypothetical protein [Corynebacterium marambiense]MBI9001358.1 hypothetical protein [Corynebacterium marambiense]MCK7664418.1 hypothetical protein [Corynebacterium marambiense]
MTEKDRKKLPEKTCLRVSPTDSGRVEEVDFNYKSDWVGRARFYEDSTTQSTSLSDLAGLDEEKWQIVGVDLHAAGCRTHSSDSVYLHVVDLEAARKEGRAPLEPNVDGKIPVVSVLCHDLTLQDIFNNVVDAEFSLRINVLADAELELTGYADRPNQD